jgi:hypothetical protein
MASQIKFIFEVFFMVLIVSVIKFLKIKERGFEFVEEIKITERVIMSGRFLIYFFGFLLIYFSRNLSR